MREWVAGCGCVCIIGAHQVLTHWMMVYGLLCCSLENPDITLFDSVHALVAADTSSGRVAVDFNRLIVGAASCQTVGFLLSDPWPVC